MKHSPIIRSVLYIISLVVLSVIISSCTKTKPEIVIQFETISGEVENIFYTDGTILNIPVLANFDGLIFDGWFFDNDYSEPYNKSQIVSKAVNNKITLYAKWIYIVDFVTNTSVQLDNLLVLAGMNFVLPETPFREGYAFDGWFIDENLSTPFSMLEFNFRSITLYAKWVQGAYKITFDENYGTPVLDIVSLYGTEILLPSTTRIGYTFDGWYTNNSLDEKFTSQTMPNDNVTLYAKWLPNDESFSPNTFYFDIISMDISTITVDLIVSGHVDIIGYDLTVIYDAEYLVLKQVVELTKSIYNSSNEGNIITNYVEINEAITSKTTLLRITFDRSFLIPTEIRVQVKKVINIVNDNQVIDVDYHTYDLLIPVY